MATYRTRIGRNGDTTVHTMVRLAGYPTRTASFPNKREAQKWAATVEAEMIEGRHYKGTEGRKRTLAEAIDRYLKEVLPQKRNGSMYGFTLKWWKDNHGGKKLGEVTRGWLADRRTELLAGTFTRATPGSKRSAVEAAKAFQRTPATANRYMAALSHVFTMACGDWEWLKGQPSPFTGLSKLRESKGRTRHLSDDERARLLAETAKDPQLHVLVQVALATAARAGELVGLTWARVELGDVDGRLVFANTKNGDTRVAWVFGEALDLLKGHAALPAPSTGQVIVFNDRPVFPGRWSHKKKAFGVYDYTPRLRKALTAAGIMGFRFHDLRHSAATGMARMGASEQQLKAIGGWKSGIASRYVHLAAQDVKGTAEAWSKKLGGG
jgi:integrase